MAQLSDINASNIHKDDTQKQIDKVVSQANEWARIISNEDKTKIVKSEDGNPILLMGQRLDGTFGFDVAQEGFDVTTASDDELAFSSRFNSLKLLESGTIVTSAGTVQFGGPGTGSARNMGQIVGSATIQNPLPSNARPIVFGFVQENANTYSRNLPFIDTDLESGLNITIYFFAAQTTASSIIITCDAITYGSSTASQSSQAYTIKYYLATEVASI